jgi:hypothetical protein
MSESSAALGHKTVDRCLDVAITAELTSVYATRLGAGRGHSGNMAGKTVTNTPKTLVISLHAAQQQDCAMMLVIVKSFNLFLN